MKEQLKDVEHKLSLQTTLLKTTQEHETELEEYLNQERISADKLKGEI